MKKQIQITVTLMDNSHYSIKADSATIAKEITQTISEKANITDDFGFSLFVTLFDKVSSLGAGSEHLLGKVLNTKKYLLCHPCDDIS